MARCYLYSKANFPTTITYDGKKLILPPNARNVVFADDKKLGNLPAHVIKVVAKSATPETNNVVKKEK